jgi:hypothetical protein
VDNAGTIYLSGDGSPKQISKYAQGSGTPLLTFGTSGMGMLTNPTALAFGPDGLLYVLDTGAGRIVKFDSSGNYQGQISPIAATDRNDIVVGSNGLLYTANETDGGTIYDTSTGFVAGALTPTGESSAFPGSKTQLVIGGNYLYFYNREGANIHVYELPPDDDGDGVLNGADQCPGTPSGAVVDATGCSIAQLVPCSGPRSGGRWRNHGAYVTAVSLVAERFRAAGLITSAQRDAIISAAARSNCGQ